ncbi:AAA family ATPase [Pelomyxa schiedti]|nr:AAA family ATPase [Pelomyxa schiedti]
MRRLVVSCGDGGDFTSLSDAVAKAPPDSTIIVMAGTYEEKNTPILINKPLTICLSSISQMSTSSATSQATSDPTASNAVITPFVVKPQFPLLKESRPSTRDLRSGALRPSSSQPSSLGGKMTDLEPTDSVLVSVSEFPIQLPVEKFKFKLEDNELPPIDRVLQETWIVSNTSSTKQKVLFVNDCNDKYDLRFTPESRTILQGQRAAVTVTLNIKCTTLIRRNIPVIVKGEDNQYRHIYVSLCLNSQISTKVDFDEVALNQPPIEEDDLAAAYSARWRSLQVSVKKMKLQDPDQIQLRELMRTVELLEQLQFTSIQKFLGASLVPGSIALLFEHTGQGSLESIMKSKNIPSTFKMRVVCDIAYGMEFLHKHGVVHHKLSPSAVLIMSTDPFASSVAKLSDFGFPRRDNDEQPGYAVDVYTAPELFSDRSHFEFPSDVYSFAMVLYFLYKGKHPFDTPEFDSETAVEQFLKAGKRLPIDFECKPVIRDLITTCWANNPTGRPDFPTIVNKLQDEVSTLGVSYTQSTTRRDNKVLVVSNCNVTIKGLEFRAPVAVSDGGSLSMDQCSLPSVSASGKGSSLSLFQCEIDPTKYGGKSEISSVRFVDYSKGSLELCNISASSASGTGVEVGGFAEPVLRSCSIRYGQVGLSFWKNGGGIIDQCFISDCGLAGVEVACGSNPTLKSSCISGSRGVGILAHTNAVVSVESCNLFDNAYEGIEVKGSSTAVLKCSYIHHNTRSGICLRSSKADISDTHIYENEIAGIRSLNSTFSAKNCCIQKNKYPGLVIMRESVCNVSNCLIRDGNQAGIFFCQNGHGTIENSTVQNNSLAGIEISMESDPELKNCIIEANRYGLHYREKGNGRVEWCTIQNSVSSNIRVIEDSEPTVRHCRILRAGGVGVRVAGCGSGFLLEQCDIAASGGCNVDVYGECSPTLRGCHLRGGGESGVRFDKNASGIVELCSIYGNALEGICVRSESSPIIRRCNISKGMQSGILLNSCGPSTVIDNCDIFSNTTTGIELTNTSAPIIRGCTIHACQYSGIQYLDMSGGSLLECKIHSNGTNIGPRPAIEYSSKVGPTIKNCIIDGEPVTSTTPKHPSDDEDSVTGTRSKYGIATQVVFTTEEIAAATDNFNDSQVLGSGSYGSVYRGVINGTPVAVKVMHQTLKAGVRKGFEYEVELLRTFRHRNLVPLLGCCMDPLALVYDLLEGGTLKSLIKQARRAWEREKADIFPWKQRLNIAIGCARGLLFLHATSKPPVIHRDFKSDNVLLDRYREPKIGDFGLARLLPKDINTGSSAGTPGYICPEYDTNGTLTTKVDVYSFGVVLLELLTGMPAIIRVTVSSEDEDSTDTRSKKHKRHKHKEVLLGEWVSERIRISPHRSSDHPLQDIVHPTWPPEIAINVCNIAGQCIVEEQAKRLAMNDVLAQLEAVEVVGNDVGTLDPSGNGDD